MRDVIWKFTLTPVTPFIDVPGGAQLLAVGDQGGDLVAWFRCDPNQPVEPRFVGVYATGAELPDYLGVADFVGTVQMRSGLVFHIFEADAIEDAGGVIGLKERAHA